MEVIRTEWLGIPLEELLGHFPTGSRVICNPPPTTTDEDHMVLVRCLSHADDVLQGLGWEPDLSYTYGIGVDFRSYRKGEVNLIDTSDANFYALSDTATHVCQKLNLHSKEDRVMVFDAVRYGTYSTLLPLDC